MEDITMKKRYQKPHTHVVVLQHQSYLLAGSPVNGNSGIGNGEGGSATPTSRQGQGFLFDED